jgi:hypothetical protein
MLQTTTCEKRPPAGLRLVRPSEAPRVRPGGAPRPAWAALYVIVALAIAMLFGVEFLLSQGPVRTGAELLTILSALGSVRIWLRCNRIPLARIVSPPSRRA